MVTNRLHVLITSCKQHVARYGQTKIHLLKTFSVYSLVAVSAILMKILIARLYGQEELGIFTYYFSFVSLLFLFTSVGFPEAITQLVVKEAKSWKSAVMKSLPFVTLFSIIVCMLSLTLFVKSSLPTIFPLSVLLYIWGYTLYYYSYSLFRGLKQFARGSLFSLLSRVIFIIAILLFPFFSIGIEGVLLAFPFSVILAFLLTLPVLATQLPSTGLRDGASANSQVTQKVNVSVRSLWSLAIPLFVMQLGFYSLRYVDALMIEYLVDFTQLGLYSAYSSVTNIIRLVAYVFPVVVLPMASVSKYKLRKSLFSILSILLPFSTVVLLASYWLIPLLYGSEYQGIFLPIYLTISSTLLVIYSYINSVLVGENSYSRIYLRFLLLDLLLSLGLNVALNYLLISKYGTVGAPIATAITVAAKILLNLCALKFLRKRRTVR